MVPRFTLFIQNERQQLSGVIPPRKIVGIARRVHQRSLASRALLLMAPHPSCSMLCRTLQLLSGPLQSISTCKLGSTYLVTVVITLWLI